MRYFLIAGEASGDLHAAHLIAALRQADAKAEFVGFGGDLMEAAGMRLLRHYSTLAFMGFVQVALHLPTLLEGLRECKAAIRESRPHAVIFVDYPGFNLRIAAWVRRHLPIPTIYYIAPKIWAWKEGRIRNIRRDIQMLLSILPFEKEFFEGKHHYPIHYVGNPTLDEVEAFREAYAEPREDFCRRLGLDEHRPLLVLMPGSRQSEIRANLPRMLCAVALADPQGLQQLLLVAAPGLTPEFYAPYQQDNLCLLLQTETPLPAHPAAYPALFHADAALVTSGTATLETALFGTPQVVCYHLRGGRLINRLRPYFLRCPFISLVNLIAGCEVVPELIAADTAPAVIARHLTPLLDNASVEWRNQQLHYAQLRERLGALGAPHHAAQLIVERLHERPQ